MRALEKLGVNYVVLHRGDYGEERFARAVADAQGRLSDAPRARARGERRPRLHSVRFAQPKGRW